MRFAAIIAPGTAWVTGRPIQEQPHFHDHVAYMATMHAAGKMVMGGPFAEHDGGLAIIEAVNADEAATVIQGSPAVAHGVFRADLYRWNVLFDALG